MPRTSRALLAAVLACGVLTCAPRVLAQAEIAPDPAAVEAARGDFGEGQGHYRAKRWAEALRAFEKSYASVPSPNAQLMIARSLRELGRGPDAAGAFASAEEEARRRVERGESKYADTAEAARTEGKAVRATLGTLKIHVTGNAVVTVDRKTVSLSKDGDAVVYREPGSAQVSVKDNAGAEQRQTAVLTSGNTVTMEFSTEAGGGKAPVVVAPPPPPPKKAAATETPGWMFPAALVAGGVTLAGAGVFVGFGASSRSTYNDLFQRCGSNGTCGAGDRAEADAGRTSQTIANIGLGVAIAGVVATAVILYLGLTNQKPVSSGPGL